MPSLTFICIAILACMYSGISVNLDRQQHAVLGGTFVDVGANIGSCSFLLASKGHHVHSLEANPKNQAMIEDTLAANDAMKGTVTLYKMGAGDVKRDNIPIFEDPGNSGNTIVDQVKISGAEVTVMTRSSARRYSPRRSKVTAHAFPPHSLSFPLSRCTGR